MSSDKTKRPGMTSGPSIPIEGPQPTQPFGAGSFPGRDAPGAGAKSKDENNPFAELFKSPYGDGQAPAGQSDPTSSFAPSISLPTGGGALRSIGEKFSPNPFTGGGSMSVPIASSPGRGGFGPELSLSYSSGLGNGPFGIGWMLGVPAISRKTDKGLPEYRDEDPQLERRDTFVLAGAEDLVHQLDDQGQVWSQIRDGHVIQRFMPRVEGGFARIERWTSQATGDVHWRTISPENVTSFFGRTASARVSDPGDPMRVFSWLLEESHDDRGNIIVYEYKQENLAGVDQDALEERPRLAQTSVQAQRYLKRIKYGNATPFVKGGWLFEVVLDYGEHGVMHGEQLEVSPTEDRDWPTRQDTFSTNRPGFELRTRRLCRRVLMFHHFAAELGPAPYLVGSTDFLHDEGP
ncbi:Mono(ADP-ribosyl)transferase SpvB [Enhygromyxa salina]|uniref:Mono(ADP-ribosyl)transferase SpvB n=1 Tax=Enhygromyxa salina TaxID=215803 RepID=A0A2S9YAU8_9BACT|nr:SpvB/TcaC N-terminal domain-containing protein [Enhygromyxa salina]PRQ02182.1 Mono(ADP-ribosyl)transferase SpvB [Enhygromyxa salina]